MKVLNWHKSLKNQISEPLILKPTAGCLMDTMIKMCAHLEKITGMRVCVKERAGMSNKSLPKSEPLRKEDWRRLECFIWVDVKRIE